MLAAETEKKTVTLKNKNTMDCYAGLIASVHSLSELDIAVKMNRLLIQLSLNLDEACTNSLEPKDLSSPQKWIITLLDLHH